MKIKTNTAAFKSNGIEIRIVGICRKIGKIIATVLRLLSIMLPKTLPHSLASSSVSFTKWQLFSHTLADNCRSNANLVFAATCRKYSKCKWIISHTQLDIEKNLLNYIDVMSIYYCIHMSQIKNPYGRKKSTFGRN